MKKTHSKCEKYCKSYILIPFIYYHILYNKNCIICYNILYNKNYSLHFVVIHVVFTPYGSRLPLPQGVNEVCFKYIYILKRIMFYKNLLNMFKNISKFTLIKILLSKLKSSENLIMEWLKFDNIYFCVCLFLEKPI